MNDTSKECIENLPEVEVLIEVPRGSFIKRASNGKVDFISLFPSPFNYGSVLAYAALDGDPLDAVVLGPRLPRGKRITVPVRGAIAQIDCGIVDDKLICSHHRIGVVQRFFILIFFNFFAVCKQMLYLLRGCRASNHCLGWCDVQAAIARTQTKKNASLT